MSDVIKITVECYDRKYEVEMSDEVPTDELVEELGKLVIAIGYFPTNVYSAFEEYGKEYGEVLNNV